MDLFDKITAELPSRKEQLEMTMRVMMSACGCVDVEWQRGKPWCDRNTDGRLVWKAWKRAFYRINDFVFYIDPRIHMSDADSARKTRSALTDHAGRADRRVLLPVVFHKPNDHRAFDYWNRMIAEGTL